MFNINFTKAIQSGLVATVLLGSSAVAQAEAAPQTELLNAIEQNIAAQTQEMMATAKREFMLSVQTQLAESMFEFEITPEQETEQSEQVAKVEE